MRSWIDLVEDSGKQSLLEMTNLGEKVTGLPFIIYASPRGKSQHSARVKVFRPPWETHPVAVYTITPVEFVDGENWLSKEQENELKLFIDINRRPLLDYWNGKIQDEDIFKGQIVGVKNMPPINYEAAVIGLRSSAPKVHKIYWNAGGYHLYFHFLPKLEKIQKIFSAFGFTQPIFLHSLMENPEGILLWQEPPQVSNLPFKM